MMRIPESIPLEPTSAFAVGSVLGPSLTSLPSHPLILQPCVIHNLLPLLQRHRLDKTSIAPVLLNSLKATHAHVIFGGPRILAHHHKNRRCFHLTNPTLLAVRR